VQDERSQRLHLSWQSLSDLQPLHVVPEDPPELPEEDDGGLGTFHVKPSHEVADFSPDPQLSFWTLHDVTGVASS